MLNTLMMIVVVILLQIAYLDSLLMPAICASAAFALFIGYTVWLWFKKPKKIVINRWLSSIASTFVLYFMIVALMKDPSPWWFIFLVIGLIIALFINMIKPKDEVFEI